MILYILLINNIPIRFERPVEMLDLTLKKKLTKWTWLLFCLTSNWFKVRVLITSFLEIFEAFKFKLSWFKYLQHKHGLCGICTWKSKSTDFILNFFFFGIYFIRIRIGQSWFRKFNYELNLRQSFFFYCNHDCL